MHTLSAHDTMITIPVPVRRRPATRAHRRVDVRSSLRSFAAWRARAPRHHHALAELRAAQAGDALGGFGRAAHVLR